jgi:hypothetical protein
MQVALVELRNLLHESKPDLVIMFGDDQRENFLLNNMPPFCVYTGEAAFGYPWKVRKTTYGGELGDCLHVRCHSEVATTIVREAAFMGFDLPWSQEWPDKQWGLPHSMIRLFHHLSLTMPVIPIHVNAFDEPAPTPARCLKLGQVIKEIVETTTPEDYRVAVIGSGGLSHESAGTNAGWIDAEHDQWVLEHLRRGACTELADVSNEELVRTSDQELRNWLCAIGFFGDKAPDYLEYVLSYYSLVGNGFAAWRLN